MEKISGIIPANRRTKAVDVSNSQPVRPGAPTWGRPVGRVTQQQMMDDPLEKVSFSQSELPSRSLESPAAQNTYNSKGQIGKSQVIEELSKKFFEPKIKSSARDSEEALSEQVNNRANESEFSVDSNSGPEEGQRKTVTA